MANSLNIKRRALLNRLPAPGTVAAIPETALAATLGPTPSPADRMEYHLAEYKKAAEEVDPRINNWLVEYFTSNKSTLQGALKITASRYLGKFEGDGWYLIRRTDDRDPEVHHVSFAAAQSRPGDRWFCLIDRNGNKHSEYFMSEDNLENRLAAKVPDMFPS